MKESQKRNSEKKVGVFCVFLLIFFSFFFLSVGYLSFFGSGLVLLVHYGLRAGGVREGFGGRFDWLDE